MPSWMGEGRGQTNMIRGDTNTVLINENDAETSMRTGNQEK